MKNFIKWGIILTGSAFTIYGGIKGVKFVVELVNENAKQAKQLVELRALYNCSLEENRGLKAVNQILLDQCKKQEKTLDFAYEMARQKEITQDHKSITSVLLSATTLVLSGLVRGLVN